jgi:hypothetical protein
LLRSLIGRGRLLAALERERDFERASASASALRAILDPDSPAVGMHDLPADRQSEPGTGGARARTVPTHEALEDSLALIDGHSGSVVGDR